MTIRKYCDLCDRLIPDDDRHFGIDGCETGPRAQFGNNDIVISTSVGTSKYIPPAESFSMVCIGCYAQIREMIISIQMAAKNA